MKRVAAADIGGTQSRFRIVDADGAISDFVCATTDYANATSLLAAGLGEQATDALCIAVGGPVTAGQARLTNGALLFDERQIAATLGIEHVAVVNDLVALGTEVPHLEPARLRSLGGPDVGAGTRAVIAAGTGLGMTVVTEDLRVLPSEGGHAPFAPADPLEQEILGLLAAQMRYVSWEGVLAGPGIQNLYRAVSGVWGAAPEELSPADVTERGLALTDPVCHQTLEIYCAILGNVAGALCVTSCARGGVYIGGGIPPRIADFLAASGFRRRFEERGRMTDYVRDIGTAVIVDAGAGLAGALRHARSLVT